MMNEYWEKKRREDKAATVLAARFLCVVGLVLLVVLSQNPLGLTEWLGGALYRIFLGVTGQGNCPEPAYGWPVQCF